MCRLAFVHDSWDNVSLEPELQELFQINCDTISLKLIINPLSIKQGVVSEVLLEPILILSPHIIHCIIKPCDLCSLLDLNLLLFFVLLEVVDHVVLECLFLLIFNDL